MSLGIAAITKTPPTGCRSRFTRHDRPAADPLTWRHTWPERGPDFVATVMGGQFARIFKTHPDRTHGLEWVWCFTYPAATRLTKQGRAATKDEAAEAVRRGLDETLRWHAERGKQMLLTQDVSGPDPKRDWMRPPVRIEVGRDVPWPEGWGPDTLQPAAG